MHACKVLEDFRNITVGIACLNNEWEMKLIFVAFMQNSLECMNLNNVTQLLIGKLSNRTL